MPPVPQLQEIVLVPATIKPLPAAITIWLCTCLFCCAALTSSCTTYQRTYTTSPEQPQSRHQQQTQKHYTINGTRYEPLSSHLGFEQEGIASSYGIDFHGRTTSNGESFDMNAMTAAHKTLPMGVFIRVQHKRNGKEVVVRINDRGPFVKDRIVDLSEAAAVRLGMLQEGLAPVKVTALGFRPDGQTGTTSYRQPASYDSGTYAIQVGAFTVRSNAYRYADELRKRFGTASVQEAQIRGKTYYRVRLGHFSSLRLAQSGQEQHERTGFPGCFVVAVD